MLQSYDTAYRRRESGDCSAISSLGDFYPYVGAPEYILLVDAQ